MSFPIRGIFQKQAVLDPMKLVHHSMDDLCDLIHKGHDASLQDLYVATDGKKRCFWMFLAGTWMGGDGRVLID